MPIFFRSDVKNRLFSPTPPTPGEEATEHAEYSKFARIGLAILLVLTGALWLVSGLLVVFSTGSSTGPMGPVHSVARQETRVSQGSVLALFGAVLIAFAVYLVFFYDND